MLTLFPGMPVAPAIGMLEPRPVATRRYRGLPARGSSGALRRCTCWHAVHTDPGLVPSHSPAQQSREFETYQRPQQCVHWMLACIWGNGQFYGLFGKKTASCICGLVSGAWPDCQLQEQHAEGFGRAAAAQVVRSAMSAEGDRAVAATDEHRVQFWELPSGRLLHDQPVSPHTKLPMRGLFWRSAA